MISFTKRHNYVTAQRIFNRFCQIQITVSWPIHLRIFTESFVKFIQKLWEIYGKNKYITFFLNTVYINLYLILIWFDFCVWFQTYIFTDADDDALNESTGMLVYHLVTFHFFRHALTSHFSTGMICTSKCVFSRACAFGGSRQCISGQKPPQNGWE